MKRQIRLLSLLLAMLILCMTCLMACGEDPNGNNSDGSTSGDQVKPPIVNRGTYVRVNSRGEESQNGNYILFGYYPQTLLADNDENKSILTFLEGEAGSLPTAESDGAWTSYRYYMNDTVEDYMWYQDVAYGEDTYRGVYFTKNRPYYTDAGANQTQQTVNGFEVNKTYWFKFEPVKWKIVSETNDKATLVCEMLIDSREFYNRDDDLVVSGGMYDPNNYERSDIRAWLNNEFRNTVFTDAEQSKLLTTEIDNGPASTGMADNKFTCKNTDDLIYLLSVSDLNTYFENSEDEINAGRYKKTTDYARCQGAFAISPKENANTIGSWLLRSPSGYDGYGVRCVLSDGLVSEYSYTHHTYFGICPALRIQL